MASKFESFETVSGSNYTINSTTWKAQTFVASSAHSVSSIKIYALNGNTATISIRATSGGFPTGSNLCSGTVSIGGSWGWYEATMGTAYNLTSGVRYAVVVSCSGDGVLKGSYNDVSDPYTGGVGCNSDDSGSSWAVDFSTPQYTDFPFQIWGDASSTNWTKNITDTLTMSESVKKGIGKAKTDTLTLSNNDLNTGAKSPGTMTNYEEGGVDWSNPNNAKANDGVYATVTTSNQYCDDLFASNFGFSIPTSAIITGVLLDIKCKCASGTKILPAGINNADVSKFATKDCVITTTDQYVSMGGESDTWGKKWTPSDFNNSAFQAGLLADGINYTNTLSVDHIRLTVYYTAGFSILKILSILLFETLNLTSNIRKRFSTVKSDNINLSGSLKKSYSTIKFETQILSDNLNKIKSKFLSLTDSLNISDNIKKAISLTKSETINLSENFSKLITRFISLIDNLNLTDSLSKRFSTVKLEIITISDNFSKNFIKFLTLIDTFTLSESFHKLIGKKTTETLNLSDSLSKTAQFYRSFTDNITLSDSIRKFINGFEQIWTKATGVVSTVFTKRTKPTSTTFTKRVKPTTSWTKRTPPWRP